MLSCYLPVEGQKYIKSSDLSIRLLGNEEGDICSCDVIVRLGREDGKVNCYSLGSLRKELVKDAYGYEVRGVCHGENIFTYAWVDSLALRPALTSKYDFVIDSDRNLQATMILVGNNHFIRLNRKYLRDGEGSCGSFTVVRMMLGDIAQIGSSWFCFSSGLSQSNIPPKLGVGAKMIDLSKQFFEKKIASESVNVV